MVLRYKSTQNTLKTLEILKDFEKSDGFHLLLGSFLCQVTKEEFRMEIILSGNEYLILMPVFLFANYLSSVVI